MRKPESKSQAFIAPQAHEQNKVSSNSGVASSIAIPCPMRFARAICGDLGQAERREWWIANGLGGYEGGTIAGSLTGRYHGLLITPVASALGRRLIFAKADATLIDAEDSWPLFTN